MIQKDLVENQGVRVAAAAEQICRLLPYVAGGCGGLADAFLQDWCWTLQW